MSKHLYGLVPLIALCITCGQKQGVSLTNIREGAHFETPVEFPLSPSKKELQSSNVYSMQTGEGEVLLQSTPAFYNSDDENSGPALCAVLPAGIKEGSFALNPVDCDPVFIFHENDRGQLQVFEKNQPVLTYNFGMQLGNNAPEKYRRSCYIHPLYDLKGDSLTDDFPEDHFHHRGLSWMWPKIFVDGQQYDIWHIYGYEGNLPGIHHVFEHWISKDAGPVCAVVQSKNFWQLESDEKVMDEWVSIRAFRRTDKGRAIDIRLTWKAVVPIEIEGQTTKGYGGLNFRFAPREHTQLFSIEGKEPDSDLKNLPWADLSAEFANSGALSGAAIFQHSGNPDFPAGWCLRHYGFLGIAWPGVQRIRLQPGESISLKARIWIHEGDATAGKCAEAYEVFQDPPKLTLN